MMKNLEYTRDNALLNQQIEYYSNGNIKYDGEYANDKFEGNGKYIWQEKKSNLKQIT